MLCKTRIASAAAPWVGARLAEESHQGRIVHAGADAVYFTSRADMLGLVTARAVPVPLALITRADDLTELCGQLPRVGAPVTIGGGRVDLGALEVRVSRFIDYRMPPIDATGAAEMADRLAQHLARADSPRSELEPTLLRELTARPRATLPKLLGRGTGLTPYGDDVVSGLLATLLAAGDPCAPDLATDVARLAPMRTTLLSATLLRRAAAGDVIPQFARLTRDLIAPSADLAERITTLQAIGHTSGAGMLLGLHLGLTHITMRSCT